MKEAVKPGIYKYFSGRIRCSDTNCVVRDAVFEIKPNGCSEKIVFDDAVFVSGEVRCSEIKNGLNLGVDFVICKISYMINKNGTIFSSVWEDGIFDGGEFENSHWLNGVWIDGVWKYGYNKHNQKRAENPNEW